MEQSTDWSRAEAGSIAAGVGQGRVRARTVIEAALARIARIDPAINAFTDVTADRALAAADALDARTAAGTPPGPLAGV
ncbi:amidase family protein, partial [Methylobacterium sp. WL120]